MCATSYEPKFLKDAFYRGALALQDVLELPYAITEDEFWSAEDVQQQFEIFVDEINKEED
jgi:hypothetical protein